MNSGRDGAELRSAVSHPRPFHLIFLVNCMEFPATTHPQPCLQGVKIKVTQSTAPALLFPEYNLEDGKHW